MLVDANIFIDVFEHDPVWWEWSAAQMKEQLLKQRLYINSIIYAEISNAFATPEPLDALLANAGVTLLNIPKQAAFFAGKAFAEYRKAGGTKTNVLSDFFIGAHAQVLGVPILTRDVRR